MMEKAVAANFTPLNRPVVSFHISVPGTGGVQRTRASLAMPSGKAGAQARSWLRGENATALYERAADLAQLQDLATRERRARACPVNKTWPWVYQPAG